MCGILGCHRANGDPASIRAKCVKMSKEQRCRGPDWSGVWVGKDSVLCHERLAIVGVESGAQPLVYADGKKNLTCAVNGEIYNWKDLIKGLKNRDVPLVTGSDCEVIMHLYKEHGTGLCNMLDGMFSFILLDDSVSPSRMVVARDPIGITTLYTGHNSANPSTRWFASELKSLQEECDVIQAFPPGHVYDSNTGETTRYFDPDWWNGDSGNPEDIPHGEADLKALRESLEMAVRKRLMSEVPFGVLLSGGLDSSLVAAIASREMNKIAKEQQAAMEEVQRKMQAGASGAQTPVGATDPSAMGLDTTPISWSGGALHSYAIGLEGSPDLLAARKAANFLGTRHSEYVFTTHEALDALPECIHALETFDVTTIRASLPMYLMSRKIKAGGVKMVLSGEGSDEIFGGYLYFHAAPTPEIFHQECVKRVKNLHVSDCLRANKSTMAFGVEARVPFLDKEFLRISMGIDAKHKLHKKGETDSDGKPYMEKYIIRKAFDCSPDGKKYLPDSILWRQKEQFSDGVGYDHINSLKDAAERSVSDEAFAKRSERWPEDKGCTTKEAYYYRDIFESIFPGKGPASTAIRWIPRTDWKGVSSDPSGRAQSVHVAAYATPSV